MKIIKAPAPILASKVKTVSTINKKVIAIIQEMISILDNKNNPIGVGLAANQAGYNLAIFIIKPSKKAQTEVFINPSIIEIKDSNPKRVESNKHPLEGCLSIPRIWGEVIRADSILLKYQNMHGVWRTDWFTDFKAVIIQHEMDHLNGILFTQRIIEQNGILYEEKKGKLVEILNSNN